MGLAIGIDLGTTNSVVACDERGQVRTLPSRNGESFMPSVVGHYSHRKNPEGQIVIGRAALDNAERAPKDTVFSIKRLMGRVIDDPKVKEFCEHFSFEVTQSDDPDKPELCVVIDGKKYTPVEISAMILKQIKEDAQLALGDEVTHAVITVPAYFEERQRADTREAGKLAGLTIKRIIDEPTAAAIAFGSVKADVQSVDKDAELPAERRHRVLVFDLGGGTFDISIIQIAGEQYQVLDVSGDNWLGGDDFDLKLAELLIEYVIEEFEYDPSDDPRFRVFATKSAEQAKFALTVVEEHALVIPNAARTPKDDIVDIDMVITRDQFNDLIRPLAERTIDLVQASLRGQNLTVDDISEVLLVGGSTAVPLIHDSVVEMFGKEKVKRNVDPMHCVALGAAILAAKLGGVECPECKLVNDDDVNECTQCGASLATAKSVGDNLTSVTANTLGIAVVMGDNNDHFEPIIAKGTPYPLRAPKRKDFFPSVANQQVIRVPVYEGESPIASTNSLQGIVEFDIPSGLPADTPVSVSFNYDRNRVISITIRGVGTNYRQQKELTRTGSYYENRPQQSNEEDDWRTTLEATQRAAEDFLSKYGDYLTPGQKNKMETDASKVDDVINTDDDGEGMRLQRALNSSIFGYGVASQLFLAERALDGCDATMAEPIQKAISRLKEAHRAENRQEVQKLRNVLQRLTEMVFERRSTETAIGDRDFENLLRIRN